MRKKISLFVCSALVFFLFLAAGCASQKQAPQETKAGTQKTEEKGTLPKIMTWSVYDVGSSGYADVAGVANALTKKYGTKIRMLPSGTSVGRMVPLRDGTATYGRLGDEYYFAFEGLYEFASPTWGPQNMRVVWAPICTLGLGVLKDSDIKTPADLKGKKVPYVIANPSIYAKMEAVLAYGGLTWKDVQRVDVPSYAAQAEALKNGQIDCLLMLPPASALYEVDSAKGLRWIEMPSTDKEGWARFQKVTPWVGPIKDDRGAGLKKGEPKELMGYPYPVCAYAKQDPEEVYTLVKSMMETFDLYKDATPALPDWALDKVAKMPRGVPFHEGTVKYLKEKGMWTEEADRVNKQLIERFNKLEKAWQTVIEEASAKGISEKEFPAYWLQRKKELVGE